MPHGSSSPPGHRWSESTDRVHVASGITEDLLLRRREPRRAGLAASTATEALLRQLAGLERGLPPADRAFVRRLSEQARRRAFPEVDVAALQGAVARRMSELSRAEIPLLAELEAEDPAIPLWAAAYPELLPAPFRAGPAERDHARAVALVAARLAERAGERRLDAFLAGLLHDAGRAFLTGLAAALEPERQPRSSTLEQIAEGLHPALGAVLAEHWNLPVEVQVAIEHHHQPGPATPAPIRRLVQVVRAADLFARLLLDRTPSERAGPMARELEREMRALDLEPELHLLERLQSELDAWRGLDTGDLGRPGGGACMLEP